MVLTKEPIRVVLNSYRKIQTYYFCFYALLKVGVATTPPWRIYLTLPYYWVSCLPFGLGTRLEEGAWGWRPFIVLCSHTLFELSFERIRQKICSKQSSLTCMFVQAVHDKHVDHVDG